MLIKRMAGRSVQAVRRKEPEMRSFAVAAVLGLAVLGLAAVAPAHAHGGYGPGYGFGGYYRAPAYGYYGNGGHDFVPHWHRTTTPFGTFMWYGNGPHDYLPHQHLRTPYSYQGFSATPFGTTQSFYPPYPYAYMPW
jgi:hypothetical protein